MNKTFCGIKNILPFLFFVLFFSCAGPSKLKKEVETLPNLSFLYNPSASLLHPEYKVYHDKESTSKLMMRLFSDELLFSKMNSAIYIAKIKMEYKMYDFDGENMGQLVDSSSVIFEIEIDENQEEFMESIAINALPGNMYNLEIKMSDLLRNRSNLHYMIVDKRNKNSRQNFNMISAVTGKPLFRNYLDHENRFQLISARNDLDSIHVKRFKNYDEIPSPTNAITSYQPTRKIPDTTISYKFNDTLTFSLKDKGIYHFQVEKDSLHGFTVFHFTGNFPKIKNVNEMIGPASYLANSSDFNELSLSENKKIALDRFWLEMADNPNRVRELIRVYYNRVKFANYYFTSDKEGWRTDRGMVYILYGPPKKLYKTMDSEKWVYYDKKKKQDINFIFKVRKNHFAGNDFLLEREEHLGHYWQSAVRSWRVGKIYIFGETYP